MNEKELNNDLQEVESEDIKKEEVKEETSKKKEQSNGMKMFKLLIAMVVAIMAFLIVTGAWNPFKSTEVEKEAIEVYEKSDEVFEAMIPDVFEGQNIESGYWQSIHGKEGEYPYGLHITDYGKEGKNGCLKETFTADMSYDMKYGLNFYVYYMKNEDYAKEKYVGLKGTLQRESYYSKEENIPNGKAYSYAMSGGTNIHFVIRKDTVAYHFYGGPENLHKMQPLFDKLNIEFKVPKTLKNKK